MRVGLVVSAPESTLTAGLWTPPDDLWVPPAHLWVPPHVSTAGADAADLAELAGLTLDPEQRFALDAILVEDANGRWAALEAAVIAARQNLKTFLFQVVALAHLFLFEAELIIWTAHLFSTTSEAFRNLDAIIAGTPEFSRRIKRVDKANGEEGFELTDGHRLKFRARSKTGGRGLTGDVVLLDEAFALGASEVGSLIPTLSARPNPQVLYGSSAGLLGSDLLRGLRDRGRKGGDEALVYLEWCAPQTPCAEARCDHHVGAEGCVLDDFDLIRLANPALDRRITRRFIAMERRSLPVEEFARERLGWWTDPAAGVSGVPVEDWAACVNREAVPSEPVTIALDVAPGHTSGAVVACGGVLHVAEHRQGTAWIVERLAEICTEHTVLAVGLDPAGPAGALIPDLENAGFVLRTTDDAGTLVALDARSQVQACESFLAAVLEHQLVHRDQLALNTAVAGAGRRQVADSWKWSRRDSAVDISPLVAATVARWLYVQFREPDRKPLMVWA